jgi:hypothetical protein
MAGPTASRWALGDERVIRSLVQFREHGERGVAALDHEGTARVVSGAGSTIGLAREAIASGRAIASIAGARLGKPVNLDRVELLVPIDDAVDANVLVSGTGLTHLGSAEGRDKMHKAAASGQATDSMRMFLMGLEGGKPKSAEPGVQPEWFYKGDGSILVPTDACLAMPDFAEDAGEEPEIAGVYLVADDGTPCRLGFALGNEFSDHAVERANYLWLAHSKLRQAALGPELLLGALPEAVRGTSRILRNGEILWEKPFCSGEANMSHSIANLEHHHFKNRPFRRPGSIHVHFFGTATLSFSDGVATRPGDVFEIEADAFRLPLRNPISLDAPAGFVAARSL